MTSFGLAILPYIFIASTSQAIEASPSPTVAKTSKVTTTTVEFEWEELLGATAYQVELKQKHNLEATRFNSQNSFFKLQIKPGKYSIRGRVADDRGVFGEWSKEEDFQVLPPTPKKLKPISSDLIKPNSKSFTAEIPLSWESTPGIEDYRLRVKNLKGELVQELKVNKSEAKAQLRPGSYKIEVLSVTPEGLESEPMELTNELIVQRIPVQKIENLTIKEKSTFSFDRVEGLKNWVRIEMQKFLSEKWQEVGVFDLNENSWTPPADLKPGRYRAFFYNRNEFGEDSEAVSEEFILKPDEKNLP